MPTQHIIELPDPVYGSLDVHPGENRKLSVSAGENQKLIHAHIGPFYLAMSELNWTVLFKTLRTLEMPAPARTFRLSFDDETGAANITLADDSEVTA